MESLGRIQSSVEAVDFIAFFGKYMTASVIGHTGFLRLVGQPV